MLLICLFVCLYGSQASSIEKYARARVCKIYDEFSGTSSSDLSTEEKDQIFDNLLSSIGDRTATLI